MQKKNKKKTNEKKYKYKTKKKNNTQGIQCYNSLYQTQFIARNTMIQ